MDSLQKYVILSSYFTAQQNFYNNIEEWDSSDDEVEAIMHMHTLVKFPVVSVENFYEYTVPRYSDKKFNKQFRITRELFMKLTDEYRNTPEYRKLSLKPNAISPGKSIAVFLWYAAHTCGMPNVADRFHISLSAVHEIVLRIIVFLSNQAINVIQWPTLAEMMTNAEHHARSSYIPGIIGCIDGTHVNIDPPRKRKDDYINRKGHMSLHVQAICNRNRQFIHLFLGYPGRVHDSRVFRNSDVPERLANLPIGQGFRLLGDSGYPGLEEMLTPYRDDGHLTVKKTTFNKALSSERVVIEHAFGILKQRFRQLYHCRLRGHKLICHFIRACFVLHNRNGLDDEDLIQDNSETPLDAPNYTQETIYAGQDIEETGKVIRNAICEHVYQQKKSNRRESLLG